MFNSLFANILYPLFASGFVFAVEYEVGKPFARQFAAFGRDLCVLALGATVGVFNNPLLLAKWGTAATLNVGLGLGILNAILVVICVKVRKSHQDPNWQARTNFQLGAFALTAVSVINIITYW